MDCSPERLERLVSDEDVEFDADIAGPGVLAAFLVTSLIALATLILAFLTISVPERLLNSGDDVIAAGARRIYHRLRFLNTKRPNTKPPKVDQSRSERVHAFMTFMVAISDQILVSQASILIAALIIHDDITIYSSNIVIALGCLASTVHLGSFPFYIDRIKDHRTAKLIRVLAMVAGSGMLVFLLVIQLSYTWDMESHVYFICALRDYRMSEEMAGMDVINLLIGMFVPLAVLYGTYEIIQLLYRDQPVEDNPNEPGSRGEPPHARQNRSHLDDQELSENGGIELQNLARLEDQANPESYRDTSGIEVESQAIVSILQLISDSNREMMTDNEAGYQHQRFILLRPRGAKIQFRELLNEIKESKRERLLNKWLKLKALTILTSKRVSTRKLRLLMRLTDETWAFHQCRGSFAWRLFWLWSGNVYGIVTIFISRAVTTGMSGNPNTMGFGQVVPLTLLTLPIFAAMEGRADYKQKLKSIDKAHADQAILETPVTGNTRSQSRHQSPAQRHNIPAKREILRIQTVQEILKKRSKDIGYPELYDWLTGDDLASAPSLQMGVALHVAVMFMIATLLGFSMAYGIASINITLIVLLFLLAARRLIGLSLVVQDLGSCPMILDHLGCSNHLTRQQLGSHGERMAIGQATGDAGEDIEEEEGQEA
ncbi:uncharacterized protein FSUBG_4272 [Fusarium subglutinans]|uniref:Uncharacterized protein n=1 Tax=Gibberella subglutinans TaxID=42677 RepID=A0A8H5Q5N8_GIBSU|nr:uncharacterized protein FSUBG_4272 [Fusarium subglutinans]KAF5609117.1 hypothetical protein FSUBG_4272 [Fusarium subglutinans]